MKKIMLAIITSILGFGATLFINHINGTCYSGITALQNLCPFPFLLPETSSIPNVLRQPLVLSEPILPNRPEQPYSQQSYIPEDTREPQFAPQPYRVSPPDWCSRAKTSTELFICNSNDEELWYLDRQMENLYHEKGKPSGQLTWQSKRNKCSNITCLKSVYRERIRILNSIQ